MNWIIVSVVVAALGLFALWLKHFLDAVGKGQESELKRIEERIDHVREIMQTNHDNASKTTEAQFEVLRDSIERLRSDFLFYGESVESQRLALAEVRDRLDKLL